MSSNGRMAWRKWGSMVRDFLLVSVPTLVVCFLAVEIPLRIAGYGQLEIYEPHPAFFWRLKPNQTGLTTGTLNIADNAVVNNSGHEVSVGRDFNFGDPPNSPTGSSHLCSSRVGSSNIGILAQ